MKYFILFASVLFVTTAVAQTGRIEGSITSKEPKSSEGATVSLLRAVDSVPVKQGVVQEGRYRFNALTEGKYLVSVTASGHRKTYSGIINVTPSDTAVIVPPVSLLPLNKDMAGVIVTAKRPLIEQKIDRTVMNVDALVSNTGVSALEVLENAPGVTVDREGNISLKGKDAVLILVDGRPSQLSGADLANMLRNMNSSQLDQVEIMTNPPARYDASGTAGVINIKTKKIITAGMNGTATLGYSQGKYPKTNAGLNFNYRKDKVNLFTNIGHSYRQNFGTMKIQRNILSTNGVVKNYFDQQGDRISEAYGLMAKMGLDYFVSKKTTVGVTVNAGTNPSTASNGSVIHILSPAKELQRVTIATVDNESEWKSFSTNAYFRTVLDKKGKELTADLDMINFGSNTKQFMVNAYQDANGNDLEKTDTLNGALPQDIRVYSGRMDYLHPLKKGARFEAGIKSSTAKTDNDASYDSVQYGQAIHDHNRSNHFIYEEQIHAAYANLSGPVTKKISMQLGLRMENTQAKGDQLTTGEGFNRKYTQLFPTAYVQYKADDKNNFVVNYGRRVRRPNYQSLNPFIKFIDRYTFSKGNPNLRPQLSDQVELTYSYRNLLTATLNYSHTRDIFDDVIEQVGEEAFKTPANIASLNQVGIMVSTNIPVTKWWSSNISLNAFNNRYKGKISGTPVDLGTNSYIISAIQQFKINPKLSGEITGRFRNGWYEGVVRAKPVGFVGAGLSQQVLKNNGTIRLTVRDMFFTQKFRGSSRYGNVDFNIQQFSDSRVVSIGFTYRFSKGKKIAPTKRTAGSAGEEQERIGND
jgi:hypothetical protein